MVVNLAVDGKHLLVIGGDKWLSTRLGIYNTKSLVGENGRASTPDAAPVGTTMTYLTAHTQSLLAQLGSLLPKVKHCNNSTHIY